MECNISVVLKEDKKKKDAAFKATFWEQETNILCRFRFISHRVILVHHNNNYNLIHIHIYYFTPTASCKKLSYPGLS